MWKGGVYVNGIIQVRGSILVGAGGVFFFSPYCIVYICMNLGVSSIKGCRIGLVLKGGVYVNALYRSGVPFLCAAGRSFLWECMHA